MNTIATSQALNEVRYEIRGQLAKRAHEMERQGYEIVHLNVGNPGRFGFRAPQTMRLAMIENLAQAEAYTHQKGIFPAREAVVMQQQNRGVKDVTANDVIIGNGVSELIDICLRGMLNPGDEILVPSPDYPLWTAAVLLNGGKAIHYPCPPENDFQPDLEHMAALITPRTRAIVVINPNNPTGQVYSLSTLKTIAALAEKHRLVLFADEIYDQILYDDAQFTPMATLVNETLCVSFGGLSKVYRACGYRVGWAVFSGERRDAQAYMNAIELLSALRLCSNVTGQWAVQTALGGYQSIHELTDPGGRLHESRQAVHAAVKKSNFLTQTNPNGAIYAFPGIDMEQLPGFDDFQFSLDLLEQQHVLIVPGSSFNVPYRNHFRITILPRAEVISDVFERIDRLLWDLAA